jgi:hypothetical protein
VTVTVLAKTTYGCGFAQKYKKKLKKNDRLRWITKEKRLQWQGKRGVIWRWKDKSKRKKILRNASNYNTVK